MTQNQVQAPPAASPPPAAPRPTAIRIEAGPETPAQVIPVPTSVREVREIRVRRSELLDQLQRAQNRRENIVSELPGSDGANRAGLEQRLTLLDQRIVQLEAEMAATEQAVANAPTSVLADAGPYSSSSEPGAAVIIPALLTIFVAFPIAIAYARRIWKRAPAARGNPAESARLERIEQAVEAIAVEVERVSEGQRFVTKLMSDTSRVPLSLPADRTS